MERKSSSTHNGNLSTVPTGLLSSVVLTPVPAQHASVTEPLPRPQPELPIAASYLGATTEKYKRRRASQLCVVLVSSHQPSSHPNDIRERAIAFSDSVCVEEGGSDGGADRSARVSPFGQL